MISPSPTPVDAGAAYDDTTHSANETECQLLKNSFNNKPKRPITYQSLAD
ncbi:hypothetical protein C4K39_2028 [Pseudomonas sessilinigenes]|nr:hypothetical protein C4K39_2028 [Pseudomonas sessilinigenes]